MQKRAQVFLIAGLIIISVILGMSLIYNTASAKKTDSRVTFLADEIKYESSQIIDNVEFISQKTNSQNPNPGNDDAEVKKNIDKLAGYYALANADAEIMIIYERKTKVNVNSPHNFASVYYVQNTQKNFNDAQDITEDQAKHTLAVTLHTIPYTFQTTDGRDIFTIVIKERSPTDEKYITTA